MSQKAKPAPDADMTQRVHRLGDSEKLIAELRGQLQKAQIDNGVMMRSGAARQREFDAAFAEIADLRDKLMAATLQNERMQGYMDALADQQPPPSLVEGPPQYQERLLRRDQFGGLVHGVSLYAANGAQERPSIHQTLYSDRSAPSWWNRR